MDLNRLKKLAGINEYKGPYEYIPENPSITASALKKKEKVVKKRKKCVSFFEILLYYRIIIIIPFYILYDFNVYCMV